MWTTHKQRFLVQDGEPCFQSVVLACGWCRSKAAAQRAIEKGEVRWRCKEQDWKVVKSWREQLPKGWPIYVQFQRSYWRVCAVMVPYDWQDRACWSLIWRGQPLTRWNIWREKFLSWWEAL